ncbi:MAG: GNAT family N-acetyltransferase [Pirellulaceae bacterium]|jgi:GNAT superfamily N-acetyltransferase|nr:GNAT family N-acetyltransferase [Pirellulaceae bacterium]MDP7020192.1 GNAT family N-acetyltransferase [Pirellulaceae bacterium]
MSDIEQLDAADADDIARLLSETFFHDRAHAFVFATPKSRERWLPKVMGGAARAALESGAVFGVRDGAANSLIAAAQWLIPHNYQRRAADHWLGVSLLLSNLSAYRRMASVNRLFTSVQPSGHRYVQLSGLVVQHEHRRRGWGARLIAAGQQFAAEKRLPIFLQCWPDLIPYYEQFGFETFSRAETREIDCHLSGLIWEPPDVAE